MLSITLSVFQPFYSGPFFKKGEKTSKKKTEKKTNSVRTPGNRGQRIHIEYSRDVTQIRGGVSRGEMAGRILDPFLMFPDPVLGLSATIPWNII